MKINDIENQIKELERTKKLLERINAIKTENINEIIYIKYIQLESVTNVAKELNEAGYRITTNNCDRKYSANDISAVIQEKNLIEDKEIDAMAKELFKQHKKVVSRRYF